MADQRRLLANPNSVKKLNTSKSNLTRTLNFMTTNRIIFSASMKMKKTGILYSSKKRARKCCKNRRMLLRGYKKESTTTRNSSCITKLSMITASQACFNQMYLLQKTQSSLSSRRATLILPGSMRTKTRAWRLLSTARNWLSKIPTTKIEYFR